MKVALGTGGSIRYLKMEHQTLYVSHATQRLMLRSHEELCGLIRTFFMDVTDTDSSLHANTDFQRLKRKIRLFPMNLRSKNLQFLNILVNLSDISEQGNEA